jgi:hypothetical protein
VPQTLSATDNIFIDNTRFNAYVFSISNGLSDHDAQCLVLKDVYNLQKQKVQETTMRIVNKESIAQFQNKLHNEKWENIY